MNKYMKYAEVTNSVDNQQFGVSHDYSKTSIKDIKDITEQSTPKEIANFITKKLMEFIEKELNTKKENAPESEKASS